MDSILSLAQNKISVITPSYNQLSFLKRCCASVADQSVHCEHIIIDGGSTDGTIEWLGQQNRVRWISEPDHGMYDAINKGFAMARGGIVAYLNCDEQYLPESLVDIEIAFACHPGVDIVYGNALLIRPDGMLAAFRKSYPLRWCYVVTSHLYVLSCTTFFRKTLLSKCGGYDISWRDVGDADLILRALRGGACTLQISRYLSVFTICKENRSAGSLAKAERRQLTCRAPIWVRALSPIINLFRFFEKAMSGAFWQSWPLHYKVYVGSLRERTQMSANKVSFRWPR